MIPFFPFNKLFDIYDAFYAGKNKKLFLRPWKDPRDQQHEEKCIDNDHPAGNTEEKRKPSG
jgi:hypothetical protein